MGGKLLNIKSTIIFLVISLILTLGVSGYTDSVDWEHAEGYWRLTGSKIEITKGEVAIGNGQASGTCGVGGFSSVSWTPFPTTAMDRQEHSMDMRGEQTASEPTKGQESMLCGIQTHRTGITILFRGKGCTTFHTAGTTAVATYKWDIGSPEGWGNHSFKFPALAKVHQCSKDSQNDVEYSEKAMYTASKKEGELVFDAVVNVRTAGGDGAMIYTYEWVPGKIKKQEGLCSSDKDCAPDELCTACGKCEKESDVIEPKDVTVAYELDAKLGSKSIKNIITDFSKLDVDIITSFSANGKKIDYCDIAMPGLEKPKLFAEMGNDDIYAGFTMGRISDERLKEEECEIDLQDEKPHCLFIISPNDRPKLIGKVNDITEEIILKIDDQEEKLNLVLKPLTANDMEVEFKTNGMQVQDGLSKSIKVNVKTKYSPIAIHRVRLSGPGEVFYVIKEGTALSAEKGSTKQITFTSTPGEFAEFGYKAPVMSNIDIGEMLKNTKSMAQLQKEALEQIAWDAALAYTGDFAQQAADTFNPAIRRNLMWNKFKGYIDRKPGRLTPQRIIEITNHNQGALNTLDKKYKVVQALQLRLALNDAQGAIDGTKSSTESVGKVVESGAPGSEKTWWESGADYGIAAIDIAQTTVGVLTIVPNKIPIVGKATAGLKTAFSAMTNIWKANLKYVSADQKIGRAKELYYPVGVIVTTEDISGWQMNSVALINIAYQRLAP